MSVLITGAICLYACSVEEPSEGKSNTSDNDNVISNTEAPTDTSNTDDSSSNTSTTDTPKWVEKQYVDEFGDPTGTTYISYMAEGTFSNSATANSNLLVEIIKAPGADQFVLYEYGNQRVNKTSWTEYDIAIKTESGETRKWIGKIPPNDYHMWIDSVSNYSFSEAISPTYLLKTPQVVKVSITFRETPTSKYTFSFDTTGFNEVYDNSPISTADSIRLKKTNITPYDELYTENNDFWNRYIWK